MMMIRDNHYDNDLIYNGDDEENDGDDNNSDDKLQIIPTLVQKLR